MLHRFKTFETFIPKNTESRFKTKKGKQMLRSKAEEMQRFKVWVPFYLDGEEDEEDTEHIREVFIKDFKKFLESKSWSYEFVKMRDDASLSVEFRVVSPKPFDNMVQIEFALAEGGFSDYHLEWCGYDHRVEP